ncbi:Dihydrolipoyl dehydrogenase [Rosistilla carotiformis]|uniref:Dihydrolipoyl dehydrogenase n=1 Tax=Rosistilla carotiformis TaxID=2528017 RepID=A0A518JP98_9BACT|nr:dihydrolipoyl dehydrogenase [Rosistilla carotiformis]QDV67366.1 Dihydrolipoyl dehydrogenase [Rosistilla carotiformis]
MNTAQHDLVVLGGGPGGYVAAIRAAQLGMNVACIDENERYGGTCLRVGCIPSKALLESSHLYHDAKTSFSNHGLKIGDVELDLPTMMSRKEKVVDTLTGGINMLLKKNKVTTYNGRGRFISSDTIEIEGKSPARVKAAKTIIAVGSRPMSFPSIEEDGVRIGNSTMALSFPEVPERLVVIGGGYIGLELGSVWNRLGSKVVVLEALDRILTGIDSELASIAKRTFTRQGLEFKMSTFVESAKVQGDLCVIKTKAGETIEADRVLLATGRVPSTDKIGLDAAGVATDKRGFLEVDANYQTSVPGVYALGDCIGGAMLAHKAMEEGVVCVERMTGMGSHFNYDVIPAIVYTHPEIAAVGKTEEQLKEAGIEYKKGMAPYGANGRAHTLGETEGRVKVLADAKTDRVLGVHIIGARAGDLIAEAGAAMEFGASAEDIARCCHAHPTLSESLHEAALGVDGRALHTF